MVVKGRRFRETVERMDDECVIGCYINGRRPKNREVNIFNIDMTTIVDTHGQVPLTPMTRRSKRPSGLAFSTYVRFHQTSVTPAKVGDARVKKKATQVNHMAQCKPGGYGKRGEERRGGAGKMGDP